MNDIDDSIKVVVSGLKDGGIAFSSNFPGFFSHIIFEKLGGKKISLNERVAYSEAFGACLAGKRSVVSMKNVGLNIASDAFLNSIISGVNAGLVLIVTDDVEVRGSQQRFDSRHYRDFFGGLWLEPTTLDMAYNFSYNSFYWSEYLDIPIVIRLTNQFFDLTGNIIRKRKRSSNFKPLINKKKLIIHPMNWRKQYRNLRDKEKRIEKFVTSLYNYRKKKRSKDKGIIVFGNCQEELKQYEKKEYDVLSIYSYPLPVKLVRNFISNKNEIVILEQGDNYGENIIKNIISNELTETKIHNNTGIIPDLTETYKRWKRLSKLFKALKECKPSHVISDVTQFTQETTDTIDTCLSMGTAIPIGIGLAIGGVKYPFCIVGDTSFLHGGKDIINEAKSRNINLGIIIIDNGGSWCTGGQETITNIYQLCGNIKYKKVDYSELTTDDFKRIFTNMKQDNKLSLLFVKTKKGKLNR